ncbi:MAG TPA: APC family permease [Bacillota bacterium]|nr:APC family permease [Bacillota bacterium]
MSGNTVHGVAGLKKHKIKMSGVVFMIYCLVAAGAFGIEEMVPISGPGLTLLMLVLFPIFWALPISEMIAELASARPAEGGPYIWARDTLGEFWGWQVGFWSTSSTWLQQALYVVLITGYMGKFFPMSNTMEWVIKLGVIAVFTIINLLGIEEVSKVSTILSLCVIAGFTVVTVVGLANWNHNPIEPFMNPEEGLVGNLGGSICIAIWMFCGYECMSVMGGEYEDPQVIPKGLILAMPLIALSYFLPTLAGLASVGSWENWAVEGDGAVGYMDVLITYVGPAAGLAFLVIAVLSNCSIFNAYILSGSRGFFVMADDHLFPRFMVRLSKNRRVPVVSILAMAGFTILLCQWDFTALVMATTPLMLYLYMALAIAVRKLRKIYPIEERKEKGLFVIKGGNFGLNFMTGLPFVISAIALYVNGTEYFLAGFLLLLAGLLGYLACKWFYGGLYRVDPEHYPLNPRTKLGLGDTKQVGLYILLSGIVALAGSLLLYLYEGSWGEEYYLETYGSGLFSNFWGMLDLCRYGGIALIVIGFIIIRVAKKIEIPEPPAALEETQG